MAMPPARGTGAYGGAGAAAAGLAWLVLRGGRRSGWEPIHRWGGFRRRRRRRRRRLVVAEVIDYVAVVVGSLAFL